MTIKKLCKFIAALSLIVPCIASEFDVFQYRLANEGWSFLIESRIIPDNGKSLQTTSPQNLKNNGILAPLEQSPVSSTATTPNLFKRSTKTFVLNSLPKLDYVIKTEEINLFNNAEKIKDKKTIDAFEKWKTITYKAIEQGYQIVLKLLLENAKDNFFIKIALSEKNIKNNLKRLDTEFPGIYDYVIKITNSVDYKRT